jgi:hypothetical protein
MYIVSMIVELPSAVIRLTHIVSIKNYILVNIVFKRYYMRMIKGAENE